MDDMPFDSDHLITAERLEELHQAALGGPLLVMTHDNPDPDALASGAALKVLFESVWGIPVDLGYSGLIDRAENKAMLNILTPDWLPLESLNDLSAYAAIALVDTQPRAGNNRLPANLLPQIVFDHHHPIRDGLEQVRFLDIRTEMAATSSIIYQYLEAAGAHLDALLSTAVFYGIQTDTQGLSRGGSVQDQEIYLKLLTQIDRQKLSEVAQAGLPREYFKSFSDGLKATRIYGRAVCACLGHLPRPDFVSEMADVMIRLQGAQAALCIGEHGGVIYLSLRTQNTAEDAGWMIQYMIPEGGKAGGHGTMAGGQIFLQSNNADRVMEEVRLKFLQVLGESGPGEALLAD